MADKVTGSEEPKSKSRKKQTQAQMGHNLVDIRRKAEPLMKQLLQLQKDMDSDMGGWKADFKALYEKGAGELGCKQSVLRKEFRRLLGNIRQEEEEQQMDEIEREQHETLRAAFAGTEFERYIEGKLAPAAKASS